ncbi:hypothetical protein OC846_005370 [Tilletia horrida]|uniref:Uncharacterized protein n=1 Tax=Tilletia horrida TaxID=155126 RepID=A0AAN6GLF4_9BASI|nr:hypothetical protein OC846_005370 [Tilletia horrida]KAK0561961.1 hypothetical protein OC861_005559 [Tilletia horrida]
MRLALLFATVGLTALVSASTAEPLFARSDSWMQNGGKANLTIETNTKDNMQDEYGGAVDLQVTGNLTQILDIFSNVGYEWSPGALSGGWIGNEVKERVSVDGDFTINSKSLVGDVNLKMDGHIFYTNASITADGKGTVSIAATEPFSCSPAPTNKNAWVCEM